MNPTTAMWINAVLTVLMGGAAALSSSSSPLAQYGLAIGAVLAGINTAFHAVSSTQPGPLSPDKK